jgi:phosphate transport system protein
MTRHFLREMEQLTRDVMVMGGLCESAVTRAVKAFLVGDHATAQTVIDGDGEVNALELRIEEEVLKILALYAPTAKDLRYVVGIFKITNDLERVGDLAVNIAERALSREGREDREGLAELGAMSETCGAMLRGALDAFVKQDRPGAEEVLRMDDQVDELLARTYEQQRELMESGKGDVRAGLLILSTAKYLERIADHCTNVAEDVIYMVAGDLVRHTG